MEIPLPETQDDIYQYGFDKNLNRNTEDVSLINNTEKVVEDMLAKAGINLNTTSSASSGGSGGFERKDYHWFTLFESIDGFNNSGCSYVNANVKVLTTAVNGNKAYILKQMFAAPSYIGFDKNLSFRTTINIAQSTSQTIYFLVGSEVGVGANVGFKIVDGTLYGIVSDTTGSATTTQLATFSGAYSPELRVLFLAGVGAYFYINGSLKGTLTTGLPTRTNAIIENITVTTNEAAEKYVILSYWDFWQAN